MIEAINSNCQIFIRYISGSEFHNLLYISLAAMLTLIVFTSIKAIFIFRKSKSVINRLNRNTKYPKGLKSIIKDLYLTDKVVVFKSKKLSAFCYGIKNPRIYISSSMLAETSASELKAVLKHEQYHLINRDSISVFMLNLAQHVFGLLPGFAKVIQSFHIKREIKADRYAISYLKNKKPLLAVIRKILEEPEDNFVLVPSIGRHETMEPRIYALTKGDYERSKINTFHAISSISVLLVFFLALIIPVYAYETHNAPGNVNPSCSGLSEQNASYPYTPAN
jgi:Zn-dependent protease with chaperone function